MAVMLDATVVGKKVLLVGGAGFIGHHLALALKEQGVDVQIMDSLGVNNISHHAGDSAEYASDFTLLPFLLQRLELCRQYAVADVLEQKAQRQADVVGQGDRKVRNVAHRR